MEIGDGPQGGEGGLRVAERGEGDREPAAQPDADGALADALDGGVDARERGRARVRVDRGAVERSDRAGDGALLRTAGEDVGGVEHGFEGAPAGERHPRLGGVGRQRREGLGALGRGRSGADLDEGALEERGALALEALAVEREGGAREGERAAAGGSEGRGDGERAIDLARPGEGSDDGEQGAPPRLLAGQPRGDGQELLQHHGGALAPSEVEARVERGGRGGDALGGVRARERQVERAIEQVAPRAEREGRAGDRLAHVAERAPAAGPPGEGAGRGEHALEGVRQGRGRRGGLVHGAEQDAQRRLLRVVASEVVDAGERQRDEGGGHAHRRPTFKQSPRGLGGAAWARRASASSLGTGG